METFRYADGRQVCTGDVVSYYAPENLGVVGFVAAKGSDLAKSYNNEAGGVFIHFLNGCDYFYDDLSDVEDIEYVRAYDEEIRQAFEHRGRTFGCYLTGEAVLVGDLVEYENCGHRYKGSVTCVVRPFSQKAWDSNCVLGACYVDFGFGKPQLVLQKQLLRFISRRAEEC